MHKVVAKPFSAAQPLEVGQVVEVDTWRTAERLQEQRYLTDPPKGYRPEKCKCGLEFVDRQALGTHEVGCAVVAHLAAKNGKE